MLSKHPKKTMTSTSLDEQPKLTIQASLPSRDRLTSKSVDSLDSEEEQKGKDQFDLRMSEVCKQPKWRSPRRKYSTQIGTELQSWSNLGSSQFELAQPAESSHRGLFSTFSQQSSFKLAKHTDDRRRTIFKSRFHNPENEVTVSSDSQSSSSGSNFTIDLPPKEGPSVDHADMNPSYEKAHIEIMDDSLEKAMIASPEIPQVLPASQPSEIIQKKPTPREVASPPRYSSSLTDSCQKSMERKMMLTMRQLVFIQLIDLFVYSTLHFFFHFSHQEFRSEMVQDSNHDGGEPEDDQKFDLHDDTPFEVLGEFLISILMAILLLASVYFKRPELTKYIVGLMFLRVIYAQVFIFFYGEDLTVLGQELILAQNFVRCTISLLISQFLTSRALKLVCSFVHYAISLATLIGMVHRAEKLEFFWEFHKVDLIIIATTFGFVEFIIFRIFDASQQTSIMSSLYIAKCQEQTSSILQGIQTGIITREMQAGSSKSIQFCNSFAFKILGEEGHWEEFKNQEGEVISSENPLSKEDFQKIIQRKQFTSYVQDKADRKPDQEAYSLLDFFEIEPSKLLDSVFFTEQGGDEPSRIYVRIHKGDFSTQGVQFESLEIQDVSREFVTSQGEKKLLSLINATVSHEMRTPINSINSQNIEMKHLVEKIQELLEQDELDQYYFNEKLSRLQQQMAHSNRIHHSSTKFLTFVINDMLDLSQLKQGKFRKISRPFDLQKAVNQIVLVQDYKAEQMGVKIKVKMDGFQTDEFDVPNYTISTDEQRLQQVLMNLVSNALKFTPSGGYIFVFCRFLPVPGKPFGKVQISVQDTGIGIMKEDQRKLFKLFGFLDTTKELNTQGIGLGLHICQMITSHFGGSMTCESEPGQGAKFTFDFYLDDPQNASGGGGAVNLSGRCLNPNSKVYPKFSLCRRTDSEHSNDATYLLSTNSRLKRPVYRPVSTIFSPDKKREACTTYRRKADFLSLPNSSRNIPTVCQSSSSISISLLDKVMIDSSRSRRSSKLRPFDPIAHQESEGKRILVADDEPFNIAALEILLKQSGYEAILDAVDFAMNGLEAVKLVKRGLENNRYSYGLILMDCSMPVQDGFETSDEIRFLYFKAKMAQPKIVACTGHCEPKYMEKAWRHNMDEFMAKPIKPQQLSDLLDDLISK